MAETFAFELMAPNFLHESRMNAGNQSEMTLIAGTRLGPHETVALVGARKRRVGMPAGLGLALQGFGEHFSALLISWCSQTLAVGLCF